MSEDEVEICLPKLGESIVSATVVRWLKEEGDTVSVDDPLVEVATDKVNSEIPSPVAGTLIKIYAQPDQQIEVGAPLAVVATADQAQVQKIEPRAKSTLCPHSSASETASKGFLSPAVLRLVRERGVPLEELDHIQGTGKGGRITKQDIDSYLLAKRSSFSSAATLQRVPMSPMRKAIAENMVTSFYQAPHAYIVTEVDVTHRMEAIKEEREAFFAEYGVKLTITSYLIQAMTEMAKQYPLVNSTLEEETILIKKGVNVGIAVAVDDGLVVPVLKECQERDIPGIAKALVDLSMRARNRGLQPDEVRGGSLTLTNFGMSGALIGLPIIRHPEVAILGIGAIQKKLVVLDDDRTAIRQIINATLSLDHRVLDGMYAGAALQAFKVALESGS